VLFKLFLLFVIVPLVELALLLFLADQTHWTVSLLLVISTGALGAWLAKGQGVAALRRIRESMTNAQVPTEPLLDAALIFFAGGMLLAPGILTDLFGISIMIPACRRWYKARLIKWFKTKFKVQIVKPFSTGAADSNIVDSYVVDREPEKSGDLLE
jgi:UPF0716 protein FxsA